MRRNRLWGFWTEQKLAMLKDYLPAFTRASKRAGATLYLDLFAGDTHNLSRTTGEEIDGSPRVALLADPPFTKVVLFELPWRAARLEAELRREFLGRDLAVVPDNCNDTVAPTLAGLSSLSWAPTFALVDQYAAEVRWSTGGARPLQEREVEGGALAAVRAFDAAPGDWRLRPRRLSRRSPGASTPCSAVRTGRRPTRPARPGT